MFLNLKNITFFLGLFAGFGTAFTSCDKLYSSYLGESPDSPLTTALSTRFEIDLYADSVNSLLPFCKRHKSVVYSLGDYSFSVSRYLHKGQVVLYIEHGDSGGKEKVVNKYYVRDNKPVLFVGRSFLTVDTQSLKQSKAYFENKRLLQAEHGWRPSGEKRWTAASDKADLHPHSRRIQLLEDAIHQRGVFDLVFEGIAGCSKAKYLILSKHSINSYRLPIKIEREDEFIQALSSNPSHFKGKKLDIAWSVNSRNETVYESGKLRRRD